ncbi:MAG: hypothetical protein HY245_10145 [Rhizobiales bacterium]|nr:hypothetical protein [Hyphomicrobiales bacterium]MBI3673761.1 hypothetical protein [Hyphomicrobiales bacterium]
MWQSLLGIAVVIALAALLARRYLARQRILADAPLRFFAGAAEVVDNAQSSPGDTIGSARLAGDYHGLPVRVQKIVDTLNVRKLPSLWLMVTVAAPLPVAATLDLMMRPSGPTTFSNFDHLPHAVPTPAGFPELAVIRSDNPLHMLPAHVIADHLEPFFRPHGKELLIAPKGLRMVIQLAEADRVRYGVFRQAEFGVETLDPDLLRDILDRLLALRRAILDWHRSQV